MSKKEIEKSQHDKSAHDLQILAIRSTVMYYDHKSKSWLMGRVTFTLFSQGRKCSIACIVLMLASVSQSKLVYLRS